jgi:hypothetical protein
MFVTKKAISRRTVLRGIGAGLALPLLDSMAPAFAAPVAPVRRFGVVYVPNGMNMKEWSPAAAGSAFELKSTMLPFAPYRDRMVLVSGLASKPVANLPGIGVHARASTRFLTDIPPKQSQSAELEAGPSIDQILAKRLGQETQLASLELSIEGRDFAGSCDEGFSCAYTNSISWLNATTPLPMENDPRVLFERLFGDDGSTDPAVQRAHRAEDRSVLDAVTEQIGRLQRGLGPSDKAKMGQYLEAVRDIERRIDVAAKQNSQELTHVAQPAGVPAVYEEHVKLMFDMQVLAYQSDMTRIITFMLARELSGRSYPEIGVYDAHHPISHHQYDPIKLERQAKINAFHTKLFSYYLERLKSTPDGDGSLLDHMLIIYGAGMGDSQLHSPVDLPLALFGGAAGQLKGGRHLKYPSETPLANMHLALLDKFGVPTERIGDSTGRLDFDKLSEL